MNGLSEQTRIAYVIDYAASITITLIALLLRVLNLGVFISGDEADFWLPRSEKFLRALQSSDFAATAITVHPGVTTMWCGSAGILLRRMLFETGLLQHETFATILAIERLPLALVHTLGVLLGFVLLRKLFPFWIAFLAAMCWATDPFIIAFSRVLHVDGPAMTFATLSLLAACVYWHHEPHHHWLIISAACAGLAILSKSPAVLVVPLVGVLGLFHASHSLRPLHLCARPFLPLLMWGLVCIATMVIAWPAIWYNPLRVYELFRIGVEVEASSPHMMGNFFLGRNDPSPGPLFYPVAMVMRMTPWTLIGVLLLPIAAWQSAKRKAQSIQAQSIQAQSIQAQSTECNISWHDIAILASFIILFTCAMTFFPKKFNRYLVPVFPAVDILAAVGLVGSVRQLSSVIGNCTRATIVRKWLSFYSLTVAIFLSLIATVNSFWYHPYGIVYFNQMFGGAVAGAQTFVVGWGEGQAQVADYLNQQPDITGVITLSKWGSSLNPYLRAGAQADSPDGDRIPEKTGYAVVYIRHVLGGQAPSPPFDQFYPHQTPLHVVNLHGVDYAWVYHVPPAIEKKIAANFGSSIRLHGYQVDHSALQSTGILTLTLQWQAQSPITEDYNLFVHVFADDQRIGQIDVPPTGTHAPTHTWQVGRYIPYSLPILVQPPKATTHLWVALGLYHPGDFTRLHVQAPVQLQAPEDGTDVLFLEPLVVE